MLVLIITLGSSWASPVKFDTSPSIMLLGDKDKQVALTGSAQAASDIWRAVETLCHGLAPHRLGPFKGHKSFRLLF